MLILYWLSVAFLGYTFLGYPLLLCLVASLRRQKHQRSMICPKVSLIIPCYNEGDNLQYKIQNSLSLTYPKDRLEIIVVSDGSEDAPGKIVEKFPDPVLKFVELPQRRGKHHAQMVARDASSGEILVFTDASVLLDENALETIVSNFSDPRVGCVSSEDDVVNRAGSGSGEHLYVRLEMWLRRVEAAAGSLVGVSGSFFAARRGLCERWHPEQSSDFFIPLHSVQQGLRTIVDPASRGHYGVTRRAREELYRKIRTIVHGLDVLFTHGELVNPFRFGFFALQLISHKLFRWLVPFATLTLLVSNAALWQSGALYRFTLLLLLALFGCGGLALLVSRLDRLALFRTAGFIVLVNAATLTAWFRFFTGEKFVTWQPTRRS
ncbi:MAG: glycosyltransferase [Terriglobales bacterium]